VAESQPSSNRRRCHRVRASGILPRGPCHSDLATATLKNLATTILLQGCHSDLATGTLPQGPCHRVRASGIMPQGPCHWDLEEPCHRDLATGILPQGPCHRDLFTGTLPQEPRHRDLFTGTFSQGPFHGDLFGTTLARGDGSDFIFDFVDVRRVSTFRNFVTGPCAGFLRFSASPLHCPLSAGVLLAPRGLFRKRASPPTTSTPARPSSRCATTAACCSRARMAPSCGTTWVWRASTQRSSTWPSAQRRDVSPNARNGGFETKKWCQGGPRDLKTESSHF